MGSLFDGIGGFPLAAVRNGIIPLWASEIENFPIEVTKLRFPDMVHTGDITKLDGTKLPPVDVICGGSPCQDLSVAGQRAGLAGQRSGLFMEQTRITKEMRQADAQRNVPDHLLRPRFLVWENVPGAFSSTNGEDFRAVIEEIVRIKYSTCDVPRPESGRWESAGAVILGTEFSLAWRTLDAQFWGVAQRRRRIFLIADFGSTAAPEILFKQDSLFGNIAESGSQGQRTAAPAQGGADDTGGGHGYIKTEEKMEIAFAANQRDEVRNLHDVAGALSAQPGMKQQTFVAKPLVCLNDHGGERMDITEEVTPTLRAGMGGHPPLLCLNDQGGNQMHCTEDFTGTLRAQEHGHQPLVIASQKGGTEIGASYSSCAGVSRNNQQQLFENHPKDGRYTGPLGVAPTLAARMGTGGNNVPLVGSPALQETICISGNTIDRMPENGGNGLGCQSDISYTITTSDRHAVFSRQRSDEFSENVVVATQSARQHKDATDLICQPYQETVRTIGFSDYEGVNNQFVSEDKCIVGKHNLIRRLTPLECERLQGFPDGWTDIPGASDSARYKALGNSVAIPCVDFVLRGIAYFLGKIYEEQEG